jgi:hypothetical protein
MSNGETDTDDRERAALLSEIDLLQGELRRHLLMLVEHRLSNLLSVNHQSIVISHH